jgi:hypothetical protein
VQKSQSGAQWRLKLSRTLLPYGRVLAAIALLLMFLPLMDSLMGWGVLGLPVRKAWSLSLGVGLLWYVVAAPDLHYSASSNVRPRPPGDGAE